MAPLLRLTTALYALYLHTAHARGDLFGSQLLENGDGNVAGTGAGASEPELLRRGSNACAAGYRSCAGLGAAGLCCSANAVCAIDQAGHVACCPQGAVCTGAISVPSSTTVTGATTATATATTTPTATLTTTLTTTPSTTPSPSPADTAAAVGRSVVANDYYPFPYAPSSYRNAAACSAAVSSCQTNLANCELALAGAGANGITVAAPNGGIAIQGMTATLGPASASAVCRSLSSRACDGLQAGHCDQLPTATDQGQLTLAKETSGALPRLAGRPALAFWTPLCLGALGRLLW